MRYGFGRESGSRGGAGLSFRGSSPPWPYVGRGRGGRPRCQYPGAALYPRSEPAPYPVSPMTLEQELDFLKEQADEIKKELERVEARIRDLTATKKE